MCAAGASIRDCAGAAAPRSSRQRVRANLNLIHLGPRRSAPLVVEHRSCAGGGPYRASLPARLWIVDAAIHILAEEAHGIGNVDGHELAVDECEERLAAIGFSNRDIRPESERIVAIDPDVIRVIGTARVRDPSELRPRKLIQGPAFRTMFSRRRDWPIERALALAPVEARQMSAREHR